jgi:hypothetical protein
MQPDRLSPGTGSPQSDANSVMRIAEFFSKEENKKRVMTDLNISGRAGLPLLTKIHGQADFTASSIGDTPFPLYGYYAHMVELRDTRTGEVKDSVRLVLVDENHITLSFVSYGAIDSLDLIRCCMGDGPFDPPLPLLVKEQQTRSGGNILRLELAE